MNELASIANQIDRAREMLEVFSNDDRRYNNALSGELERMTTSLKQMTRDIAEIKDFFFNL